MTSAKIGGTRPQALPDASTSASSTIQITPSITHPSIVVEPTAKSPLNKLNSSELPEHQDKIEPVSLSANLLIPLESLTNNSIPRHFRAECGHQIPQDPKHPAQKSLNRIHKHERAFNQLLEYAKRAFRKLRHRPERNRGVEGQDDAYILTVELIFQNPPGREIHRYGKATLDTGNPFNIVSPSFAAKFGLAFDASNTRVILRSLGGGHCASMGTISGRWYCMQNDSRDVKLHVDPKFIDADFEVSSTDGPFDVIIGSNTIRKERLLELGPGTGFTGFRTKLNAPKDAEIEQAERKNQKDREKNITLKRTLQGESLTSKNEKTHCSKATNEKP